MTDDRQGSGQSAGKAVKDTRQQRLKLALRENLKRRKSQARERADSELTLSDAASCDGGEEDPG